MQLLDLPWPALTDRLTLRPLTTDDVEATWAYRRLPEVCHWMTRAPGTLDDHRARFTTPESLASSLVIEPRDAPGEVIGDVMVRVQSPWAQAEVVDEAQDTEAELGWSLHPDQQGHGYATEAVGEAIRICFDGLGLRRVIALCFADNTASRKVMERLGMRCEGVFRQDSLHRDGIWLDGAQYALLADEWRAGKS